MSKDAVRVILSESQTDDNPDNHPKETQKTKKDGETQDKKEDEEKPHSRRYAIELRAALIAEKNALQDKVRALGMQIAAIEKEWGINH